MKVLQEKILANLPALAKACIKVSRAVIDVGETRKNCPGIGGVRPRGVDIDIFPGRSYAESPREWCLVE